VVLGFGVFIRFRLCSLPPKELNAKGHGGVFFCCMLFCREAMHLRNRGMSFFAMPLAQTWLAITMFKAPESICSLQARKVICKVAPGQALLCFDNCPEKRDESNPHTIGIGWLKFIPFFGTLQPSLLKGHMAKKDTPLFPAKKTSPCSAISL